MSPTVGTQERISKTHWDVDGDCLANSHEKGVKRIQKKNEWCVSESAGDLQ